MRYVVAIALVAACGDNDRAPAPDASNGVQVTGCDDPSLWTAPAIARGQLRGEVGGAPCTGAQYPLHRPWIGWYPEAVVTNEERARIDRTCWRVIAATPGSGWSAGDTFAGDRDGVHIAMAGFASTLTLEGRVLRDDGTVLFALEPGEVALDDDRVLDADASDTIAVASPSAWATRTSVHAQSLDASTDEVVDVAAAASPSAVPFTVHRTAAGFMQRAWRKVGDQLVADEVALGPGTRARAPQIGRALVIDSELLFVGRRTTGDPDEVLRRVALAAEPLEVTGGYFHVALHLPGVIELHAYESAVRTLAVGEGALLPVSYTEPHVFFDGTSLRTIDQTQTTLALGAPITPRADDLAAIGTPRGVYHGVVFGDRGLLLAVDASSTLRGPRVATFAELFGDPEARLGPVAADSAAYVIRFGDGSAKLYNAPFIDYCE